MTAWTKSADGAALSVLDQCSQFPIEDELLPLLALSVLATGGPFSAARVSSEAAKVAATLEAAGGSVAADRLVTRCSASLQRYGAEDAAADLRESLTILRWKALRAARTAQNPGAFNHTDGGCK